jgi:hypothetical protein
MKSMLIISLFTILRLGVPAAVLLLLGEAVRRHDQKIQASRGVR